jgi:hypothetical protein
MLVGRQHGENRLAVAGSAYAPSTAKDEVPVLLQGLQIPISIEPSRRIQLPDSIIGPSSWLALQATIPRDRLSGWPNQASTLPCHI